MLMLGVLTMMKIYNDEENLLDVSNTIAKAEVSLAISSTKDTKATVLPYTLDPPTRDMMAVQAILVTTNWNANDDVFSPGEVWPARFSPMYKPVNMEHKGREDEGENKTIGVICKSDPVDDNYEVLTLASDTEIPNRYHILVGIYLWEKYWPTYVGKIRDGIDSSRMFISMECHFEEFGYAIKDVTDSSQKVILVPRNSETAWLTKYLKAYRGPGEVKLNGKTYRVGRHLQNLIFTGGGFTIKPANAESYVFDNYISNASVKEVTTQEFNQEFSTFLETSVFTLNKGTFSLWQN